MPRCEQRQTKAAYLTVLRGWNTTQHSTCVSTIQITRVRNDMSKEMMTSLASQHTKEGYCGYLLALSNNKPTCWCFSFHGLGHWLPKIPFPGLTHYHCYMGSNWAIHSKRKPRNFPPKHGVNCSSVSVMSGCEKPQTLTTSHLFGTDGLTECNTFLC